MVEECCPLTAVTREEGGVELQRPWVREEGEVQPRERGVGRVEGEEHWKGEVEV